MVDHLGRPVLFTLLGKAGRPFFSKGNPMKMVALTKFNYGTRRLQAGDEFEPDLGNHDLMIALSLARTLPDDSEPDAKYAKAEIDLDMWREQYRMIYGHRCDMRWGVKRIRQEIEKVPGDHKIMKHVPIP